MEVRKWQKKTGLLARFFELSVPVMFISCMIWVCNWRVAIPWFVLGSMVMLAYMGMLRGIVELTWRRQAQDWLAIMRHRLTESEAKQLKTQTEDLELNICKVRTLVPAVVLIILAYVHVPVLSVLARVVVAVLIGGLIISHFLMACMLVRDEIAKIWHSV